MRATQSFADSPIGARCRVHLTIRESAQMTGPLTCPELPHVTLCVAQEGQKFATLCILPPASRCLFVSTRCILESFAPWSTTYQSLKMSASPLPIRSSEQGAAPPQPAQPVPQEDNIVCTRVRRDILSTKSLRRWGIPYRCETVSDSTHVLEIFCLMERCR